MDGLPPRSLVRQGRAAPLVLALAAALLLGSGGPALADQAEERAQDVIDALRKGDVASALGVLGRSGISDELAKRPELVHVLCDRAYRCDEVCSDAPGDERIRLSAELMELAEAAHTAAPGDVRAQWALAHAIVLRERTGPAEGTAAWLRAADLLEQAHDAHPAGGEALGYAVTFLLEGAILEPGDQHSLQKRAAAVAKAARRAHPDTPVLATTIASAHTWAARMLVTKNRRAAKGALGTSFDMLRPYVTRDLPPAAAAGIWNDAVTLDAECGFALQNKYVTVGAAALGGDVVFDVPISPRWTVTEVPATEEYGAYVYVTQSDAAGTPVRQLIFRRYTWGLRYAFDGPNEVNGDNVKKIAEGLRAVSVERLFADGAKAPAVRKSKLSRQLSGRSFRIDGVARGDEGGPLAVHGYVVRGAHQESFGFLVYVYGDDHELGPEMEAVLSSLEEPES